MEYGPVAMPVPYGRMKASKEANLEIIKRWGFARIAERIEFLWGTREAEMYFYELLVVSDRDGREGFPCDVFIAILRLHNMHKVKK